MKEHVYTLKVTAHDATSTDPHFSMDNVWAGDALKPVEVYFENESGEVTLRERQPYERSISNQTLPRLAAQIFEDNLLSLSPEDRLSFPVCRYGNEDSICGLYFSINEFREVRNTIEFVRYKTRDGRTLVFYCWNIFSTLVFVQECLKRFGQPGDTFVLRYQEKEPQKNTESTGEVPASQISPFAQSLKVSRNIIFRGAPGTGKSYLAKKVAAQIISEGKKQDYDQLTEEELAQVEFVQFHPSYDYTDFVEGLRPVLSEDGTVGFELKNGIFKNFVNKARKNYRDSEKSNLELVKEVEAERRITSYLNSIDFEDEKLATKKGSQFRITNVTPDVIEVEVPENEISKRVKVKLAELKKLLEAEQIFTTVTESSTYLGRVNKTQGDSYLFSIYEKIVGVNVDSKAANIDSVHLKNFVFIIDEINRGEISKIFGELFFAIDPGYRGPAGTVSTQYANLAPGEEATFYIPENVYIIGTMNDIDRSVDSFDFAMRRRFRFIEIKAEEQTDILNELEDESLINGAIDRLVKLNQEIEKIDGLNRNYHVGPAYFLKVKELGSFDLLWSDYLEPLLQEYVRGLFDEDQLMEDLRRAYFTGIEETHELS
ncbi:McrB family protein [Rothia nasimurium]|uniref:McrB family protein n=1 Tax=Rothia nasimurium TaxID=85336 RepID=UPI001F02DAD1|nr:AAA family ATPase [Rothia nasimurium]